MRNQILFVQGGGEGVHDAWDHELVRSLELELGGEYAVLYPRMPDEAAPRYSSWKTALLNGFNDLEEGAVLVGHSIGGAILIHVLAEQRPTRKPGAILLIAAPFIGEGGWHSDELRPFKDLAQRLPVDVPVFLYHGTADETVPAEHVRLYAKAIPRATIRVLAGRNHQLNNNLSEVAQDIRVGVQLP